MGDLPSPPPATATATALEVPTHTLVRQAAFPSQACHVAEADGCPSTMDRTGRSGGHGTILLAPEGQVGSGWKGPRLWQQHPQLLPNTTTDSWWL